MNCARLNFSHGDHDWHLTTARLVRKTASETRTPMAIIVDLQGPKMRLGTFKDGSIELSLGDPFALTTEPVEGTQDIVSVSYVHLPNDVKPGDSVALDDGMLRLQVKSIDGNVVHTIVECGGLLSNHKGMNLPGAAVSAPPLSEKDRIDLAFAIQHIEADYIALSFVRSAEDILEAKKLVGSTPIIAKIERPEAIHCLDEIVEVSDVIMIARGDLGVELGAEKVPMLQKRIIREANANGKAVITATQMLDSMIRLPRPTRAEAADVANAVMDGTDAVMLSGETAAGHYPIESTQMMDAIISDVETDYVEDISRTFREFKTIAHEDWEIPNASARAAAVLTTHLPLKAVAMFTTDGRSASLLAEHRPRAPIVAITNNTQVAQRLSLQWGVIPRLEVPPESLDEALRIATAMLVREKLCKRGDAFAMVVGWPTSGRTNTIKIHRI